MPANTKIKDKRLKIKDSKTETRIESSSVRTAKAVSRASKFSIPVYSMAGARKGTVELPKEIFGAKVNEKLMAQAVRVYLVNQKQGTASTKTRGEVTGSTRKIYRQKGTGRARHGSIRAPIFRGGGIVFGPRPRKFGLKLSKQMKKKALSSALTWKFLDQKVSVFDPKGGSGKTREFASMLKKLNFISRKGGDKQVLFVIDSTPEVKRAVRNIEGVTLSNAESINTYEVLANKNVIFAREAIPNLVSNFLAPPQPPAQKGLWPGGRGSAPEGKKESNL